MTFNTIELLKLLRIALTFFCERNPRGYVVGKCRSGFSLTIFDACNDVALDRMTYGSFLNEDPVWTQHAVSPQKTNLFNIIECSVEYNAIPTQ